MKIIFLSFIVLAATGKENQKIELEGLVDLKFIFYKIGLSNKLEVFKKFRVKGVILG